MRRGIGFDRLQYRRGSLAATGTLILRASCRRRQVRRMKPSYYLRLARDLELLKTADWQPLSAEVLEVKRVLASLMKKLRADG
jgi:hypothetical protein